MVVLRVGLLHNSSRAFHPELRFTSGWNVAAYALGFLRGLGFRPASQAHHAGIYEIAPRLQNTGRRAGQVCTGKRAGVR